MTGYQPTLRQEEHKKQHSGILLQLPITSISSSIEVVQQKK